MIDVLQKLTHLANQDAFFWFCALSGSALFAIQLFLTLLGVMDYDDIDGSSDVDAGKVKWLSKQALTGFLMMFGWTALAGKHELGLSQTMTVITSCAAGVLTILVIGWLFKIARKFRSTGTVFRIDDAVGKEAVVYQQIPREGVGKITVSLHNLTHEIDAVSLNGEIQSFVNVEIVKKLDDKTVLVVPIKK